jgi:hypothetical protein
MDSLVIFEWEEVSPVSGDDEIGFAGNCTSEDVIIGGIIFDDVGNGFRRDDFCYSLKAFCPSFNLIFRPLEFLPEDVGELGYDGRGYEDGVSSSEAMFPNCSKLSLGVCEDRNVDVGIENNPKPSFWSFFCNHEQSFPRPAV